jgi:hypothetical protein
MMHECGDYGELTIIAMPMHFHDDVKKKGRLNEVMLPVKTDGLITTAMTKVPFALRMIRKGNIL